jgi:hypothetical protein
MNIPPFFYDVYHRISQPSLVKISLNPRQWHAQGRHANTHRMRLSDCSICEILLTALKAKRGAVTFIALFNACN